MKKLILSDGTQVEFTDSSTVTDMKAVVKSFEAIDKIAPKMIEENFKSAEFDGETIVDIIPVSVKAEKDGENIVVTFINRHKSEIESIRDMIEEIQIAMTEIVEG